MSRDPGRRMKFKIEIDNLGRRTFRLLRLVSKSPGTPNPYIHIIIITELDPSVAGGIARAYGVKVKKIEE